MRAEYPILEFDPSADGLIDPRKIVRPIAGMPEHCVLSFFREMNEKLVASHGAKEIACTGSALCRHPVHVVEFAGRPIAVAHPGVGASYAAAMLEEFSAMGCRKFIACGSCGVLRRETTVGHAIIVTSAVRDEGASYHYLPASREVSADPRGVAALEKVLARHTVPYLLGKTWTTDAFYRETPEKIRRRRDEEGCITVEMEASAFMAVAQFRQLIFGQVLYAGDDCSGTVWDGRQFHSRTEAREKLFWLAAEACLEL